ncbi:MAG TPA: cytochrome P450, partial [Acidimicrobiales bacterium]|nr:cytochrome P450 [Acidimicrobiales bacterium]
MQTVDPQVIADPLFWQLPLSERMRQFSAVREQGPFVKVTTLDPLTMEDLPFYAVTRMAEVTEISRRPLDFCSGRGSTSIPDLPAEAM